MACCVYAVCWPGMVVPFVLPDTWASPERERERFLSWKRRRDSSRPLLLISLSLAPGIREMNSPDERIWRTVIVSVGAEGISRGRRRWHKSFQGFSSRSPLSSVGYRCSTRGRRLKLIGRPGLLRVMIRCKVLWFKVGREEVEKFEIVGKIILYLGYLKSVFI